MNCILAVKPRVQDDVSVDRRAYAPPRPLRNRRHYPYRQYPDIKGTNPNVTHRNNTPPFTRTLTAAFHKLDTVSQLSRHRRACTFYSQSSGGSLWYGRRSHITASLATSYTVPGPQQLSAGSRNAHKSDIRPAAWYMPLLTTCITLSLERTSRFIP